MVSGLCIPDSRCHTARQAVLVKCRLHRNRAGIWLLFALQYAGGARGLGKLACVLLAVEPLAVLFLLWSGDPQSLFRQNFTLNTSGKFVVLAKTFGPVFWIHAAYSYLLLLSGTLLLILVIARSPFTYARQLGTILIGLTAPWLANAVYISGISPFPHLDLTPFAFIIMGLEIAWGLFRFHFLDIVPIARDTIVEDLRDGVIVLNARNQIIDMNPAAKSIVGRSNENLIVAYAVDVFAALHCLVGHLKTLRRSKRRDHYGAERGPPLL